MKHPKFFPIFFAVTGLLKAQDPENLKIEMLSPNVGEVTWSATIGRSYFLQWSSDLISWKYFPILEYGDGTPQYSYGFYSNSDRFFTRLKYTDLVTSDALNDDFDNDGVKNEDEYNDGTDAATDESGGSGGGGGGESYDGNLDIPTNQEVMDLTGDSGIGVRKTETQTFNYTEGSSSFVAIVGIHSAEYPNFTGNGSLYDDTIDYTITPDGVNPITENIPVNDYHDNFENEGVDFDLGEGSKFYFVSSIHLIENKERESQNIKVEIGATNVADGSLPSGATIAVLPLQIQPKATSSGNVGDLIMSVKGKSGEKHFVSTKKDDTLDTEFIEFIEFKITGISKEVFDELFEWDGGEAGATTMERKVTRETAIKEIIQVKTKKDQTVVDKINVWIVWADLNSTVGFIIEDPIVDADNNQEGVEIFADFTCEATIQPTEIITDDERPNLSGANVTAVTGVNISGGSLARGADRKWDLSRRIERTMTINANPQPPLSGLDKTVQFPTDKLVGNDDNFTNDETNGFFEKFYGASLSFPQKNKMLTL